MVTVDYDSGGRIQSITLPASDVRTFSYTTMGQLQTLTGPDATLTFTYDGPLLTSESWSGAVSGSVARGFDDNFRQNIVQVSNATAISFVYDDDGLMTNAGVLSDNHISPSTTIRPPHS